MNNLSNETLFFLQTFVALTSVLIAGRLGRAYVIALLAVMIVLMNLYVLKQMNLFGMALTGGNVLYASVFLATDLLAEHWGKRVAYRAVRVGFFASLFFVVTSGLILKYDPNPQDWASPHLAALLAPQWRIVGASMLTYLLVQHLDVWLYEWWRKKTDGRALWLRNNGSTWVSQAVDSILFTLLAFAGAGFPLLNMILCTYLIKIIVATLDTPILYLSKTNLFRPRDAEAQETTLI